MLSEDGTIKVTDETGLAFWMERVVQECDRVTQNFAPEPVHDLRVALRRCRSIAEGYRTFDPNRAWREMRKEGARLFKKFGELRDTQVMIGWLKTPGAPQDDAVRILHEQLAVRENELKEAAAAGLHSFNRRQWAAWAARLVKRASRIPLEGAALRHLALERWHEAHCLHRQALRNRSHISFHRLRIGLKKFRYTAENFLPSLLEEWGTDLRELQDLLGELHDLHVLLQTATGAGVLWDKESRARWRSWIAKESSLRLDRYRRKMSGRDSLWRVWRARLPQGEGLESAVMERLETWASFRDPDCALSKHVADLALQLYDGLVRQNLLETAASERSRAILRVAALMRAVGSSGRSKKPHRESYRMISAQQSPIGWAPEDFKMAALLVRYHRGALPTPGRKELQGLSVEQQKLTVILAGILRLAAEFGGSHPTKISRLEVHKSGQALVIRARGFHKYDPLAQKLARARYLLEVARGLPVIIRSR